MPNSRFDQLHKHSLLIAMMWSALVCGSLAWNVWQNREQAIRLGETEAKTNLQRDLALRLWATKKGGIYLLVNETTHPNPFLSHIPNRDLVQSNGEILTLMNPATMLREMKQEQEALYGVLARITGEKILNPANKPDAWEAKALGIVKRTLQDYKELTEINGKPYIRMMQPMLMEQGCLKCHAWTEIPVGQLRGATDVAIPLEPYLAIWRQGSVVLALTHGGIWLLGLGLIALISLSRRRYWEANTRHQKAQEERVFQLEQEMDARRRVEEELRRSHDEMEERVRERTAEIGAANQSLRREAEERAQAQARLESEHLKQQELIGKLEDAQNQLLQSEKMASIGQLAAGVAHEINNPTGFVQSNLNTLQHYVTDLLTLIGKYETAEQALPPAMAEELRTEKAQRDLAYIREDLPNLIQESLDGVGRVKRIVQDLKDFSHVDENEWQSANLEQGLDSTLNVVWNELKYKCQVVKEYGGVGEIACLASQLNQVFMNLLVNAAQAIENKGTITIRTGATADEVWVEIADTGKGIAAENLTRIFEPFFTTKPIGTGTGLGLSLSYGIVQKHGGRIEVESEPGKGTRFTVRLPKVAPG